MVNFYIKVFGNNYKTIITNNMENHHLSRRAGNTKSENSDVIDDLIREIEELEDKNSDLENTIKELEDKITELEDVILDFEDSNN